MTEMSKKSIRKKLVVYLDGVEYQGLGWGCTVNEALDRALVDIRNIVPRSRKRPLVCIRHRNEDPLRPWDLCVPL